MAAAVEAREPMLDHHLVEWANGLRVRTLSWPGGVTKSLLRDVAAPWLPADIVDRAKNGFAVPTGAWMMPGQALGDRVRRSPTPARRWPARSTPGGSRGSSRSTGRGEPTTGSPLWTLVALDAWARIFLGPRPASVRLPGAAMARAAPAPVSPP